jgi:hypothetical protein
MNAVAKIDRLIEITGTPPERREIARKNYQRLLEQQGEQAIDQRLAEFQIMHEEVAAWRERRGNEQRLQKAARHEILLAFLNFLARQKLLVRRVEEQIDVLATHLDHLHVSGNVIDLPGIEAKIREAGSLLGSTAAVSPVLAPLSSPSEFMAYFGRVIDAMSGKVPTTSLDAYSNRMEEVSRLMAGPGKWTPVLTYARRIDTYQAISGLGRIAAYANDFLPDAIFALNLGGAAVGAFVKNHLHLSVPVIPLSSNSRGIDLPINVQMPARISRPLVVDSIARSGGSIGKAFDWIAEHYPNSQPRATTIAASLEAIEHVGQACLLTANPTEDRAIELPYNARAGFAIKELDSGSVYVFGAGASAPEDRLVLPTEILNKVVAEQARFFSDP